MKSREIWLPDKIDKIGSKQALQRGMDPSTYYATLLSDFLLAGDEPPELAEPNVGMVAGKQPEGGLRPRFARLAEKQPEGGLRPRFARLAEKQPEGFRPRMVSGLIDGNPNEGLALEEVSPDTFQVVGSFRSEKEGDAWQAEDHFDVSRNFPGFPRRSIEYAQRVVDEALKLSGVVPKKFKGGISFKPNFVWIEALLQRKSGIRVSLHGRPSDFVNGPQSLGPGRGSYSRAVITTDADLEKMLPLVRQAYERRYASEGKDS